MRARIVACILWRSRWLWWQYSNCSSSRRHQNPRWSPGPQTPEGWPWGPRQRCRWMTSSQRDLKCRFLRYTVWEIMCDSGVIHVYIKSCQNTCTSDRPKKQPHKETEYSKTEDKLGTHPGYPPLSRDRTNLPETWELGCCANGRVVDVERERVTNVFLVRMLSFYWVLLFVWLMEMF